MIRHRHLLYQSLKREIQARYRGSVLGILWSLATPLLMLTLYTFVFAIVLKARWGVESVDSHTGGFAIMLFSGLMLHQCLSEILTRSPTLILSHAHYVKKVVYPLEILSPQIVGAAFFQLFISLIVLLAGLWVTQGSIPVTTLWLPVILLPFLLLCLGLSWLLAAMGTYLRDTAHLTTMLSPVLLFFSTIFYPAERLPEAIRPLIYLNPLTPMTELTRDILILGNPPSLPMLTIFTIASLATGMLGWLSFKTLKNGFADIC